MKTLGTIILSMFVGGILVFYVVGDSSNEEKDINEIVSKEESSYFEENMACLELKDSLVNRLKQSSSPFGELSLEQIFYSPKVDSCLYVEYSDEGNFYNKRLLDIRNDGYSSDPLEMCSAEHPSLEGSEYVEGDSRFESRYDERLKGCASFEEKVEKYK